MFKFSNGWLHRFIKRNNLTSRAVTSVGQIPGNAKQMAESFLIFWTRSCLNTINCEFKFIGGMDETPVWFDLPSSHTYDFRGIQAVKEKTTGKEKLRYTMVLSAMADGTKLLPLLIFGNLKKIPKGNFPKDVVMQVAEKGTMNSDLMNVWKKLVWSKRDKVFSGQSQFWYWTTPQVMSKNCVVFSKAALCHNASSHSRRHDSPTASS